MMRRILDQMNSMSFSFYSVKGGAFYKLGDLYMAEKCFKKALDGFDTAIKSAPRDPNLHLGRGMAQMDLYKYSKAMGEFYGSDKSGSRRLSCLFRQGRSAI